MASSGTPRIPRSLTRRGTGGRRSALTALAAGIVATGSLAAAPAVRADDKPAQAPGVRFVDIAGDGGTTLKANVVTPSGARPGERFPVVVLPTSWGMPQVEYLAQAKKFADSGYVVVSYNARGFWQSGGNIETAGPEDVRDASKVIDWALAHTPADPSKVGMAGVSYGAGIGLLASGHDKRIKSVAALSGWADLIGSIYSGRTQHAQAAGLLGGAGALTGRPSPELKQVLKDFLSSNLAKEDEMIAWGKKRSAAYELDRINRNKPAIMMGNAWGDSIFPPNQYADFFEKLKGPKRLEFRPGDHATAEAGGLLGLPNDTWTSAHRWFDRYLKGERNGVDQEAPVRLKSRSGGGYEGYRSWSDVPSGSRTLDLAAPRKINGRDSGADGGVIFLSSILDQFLKAPPGVSLPLLPRERAAVWKSAPYEKGLKVRGTPRLNTTVRSAKSSGTGIAYLYDVGPLGGGKLVTHAPFTFHDKEPGKAFPVSADLFSTAYDVPRGHRLALVVDGADPLYIDHNSSGSRLSFSSPEGRPSRLEVPTGD
ncbi:alpha/beta fold hydrolase [Streptomyces sp. ODS28]|uniref:alpha/beta fold hydrolase n=1 Tax=Streptomyces sp. ODS28 TaxID=3136688 RepID=UPI0031E6F043